MGEHNDITEVLDTYASSPWVDGNWSVVANSAKAEIARLRALLERCRDYLEIEGADDGEDSLLADISAALGKGEQ